jgi:two-component sensor histidine kinase
VPRVRILLLEDSEVDAELICEQLRRGGMECDIVRVAQRDEFAAALDRGGYDLILSDYSLPSFDGGTALALTRTKAPDTPFIFVSGVLGEERAIESLKLGATDYVLKQRLQRLPLAVERALSEAEERNERQRAEERSRTLVAELNHRVKNLLALVSAMASMTYRSSSSLPEFHAVFQGRLGALSDAHSLAFQHDWKAMPLGQLLDRVLSVFDADGASIVRDGPDVPVPPRHAMTLALVLHELGTNAAKYGALRDPGGSVEVVWRTVVDGSDPELRLSWRERGGPPVEAPAGKGFGSMLIDRTIRGELGGRADFRYPAQGFECDIRFPVPWLRDDRSGIRRVPEQPPAY